MPTSEEKWDDYTDGYLDGISGERERILSLLDEVLSDENIENIAAARDCFVPVQGLREQLRSRIEEP